MGAYCNSTAPRALERRLPRLVKDGSAVSGGGPKLWGCRELKLKNRLYLRLTYLFRAVSVLAADLHLFLPSLSKISAARRDCGELADLQAKACAANRSRSSGRERLCIRRVAHGRQHTRTASLLDRTPQCSPGAPVAEASEITAQVLGAPRRARGSHAEDTEITEKCSERHAEPSERIARRAHAEAVLTRPPPQVSKRRR